MRGEWIEISMIMDENMCRKCLSPCGESGLKLTKSESTVKGARSLPMRGEWIEINSLMRPTSVAETSLPMRGEWIEISIFRFRAHTAGCLSPCGESGLKFACVFCPSVNSCLSPCGESGLKYSVDYPTLPTPRSLPMRGEWIEMESCIMLRLHRLCLSPCGESGLKCKIAKT